MVHWVVGSILHGGPTELFLIPASVSRLVYKGRGMWDDAIKEHLLLIGELLMWQQGFSRYLNGHLPYV